MVKCGCNSARHPPTGSGGITAQLEQGILRVNVPVDTKDVCEYETHLDFPAVGATGILYVATLEDALYRYEPSNQSYQCISRGDAVDLKGLQETLQGYLKTDDLVEITADEVAELLKEITEKKEGN